MVKAKLAHASIDYDLRHLAIFVDVCQTGSMTETAYRVGLTQPAVSQAISVMEKTAGAPLLDRNQRPLQLTPAGRVLLGHARELVQAAHRLSRDVRSAANMRYPMLRIGVVDSVIGVIAIDLMQFLEPIAQSLSIRAGLAPDQRNLLVDRTADIVISSDPLEDIEGLERYELVSEPFVVVLGSPSSQLRELPLADLAEAMPLMRYSAHSHIGQQVEQHLKRLRLDVRRFFEVDTSDALFEPVRAGLCWTISTPLCIVSARGDSEQLIVSELKPGRERSIYLLARRNELGDLPARLAELVATSIRQRGLEQLFDKQPWLRDRVRLHDIAHKNF